MKDKASILYFTKYHHKKERKNKTRRKLIKSNQSLALAPKGGKSKPWHGQEPQEGKENTIIPLHLEKLCSPDRRQPSPSSSAKQSQASEHKEEGAPRFKRTEEYEAEGRRGNQHNIAWQKRKEGRKVECG